MVTPHHDVGFPDQLGELEARLASWPNPGLATVAATWLGEQSALTMFGGLAQRILPDGTVTRPFANSPLTLADLVDAYLYLGPVGSYTRSEPDLTFVDDADRIEVGRRRKLLSE